MERDIACDHTCALLGEIARATSTEGVLIPL